MINRKIVYINVPNFGIEIERKLDGTLKNRPCVIAPPLNDRSMIWESSLEAKENGVRENMSLATAKKICPDLITIYPRIDLYQSVQNKIEVNLLQRLTPLFEIDEMGRSFLDLTGMEKLLGPIPTIANFIQKEMMGQFSLKCNLGGGACKLISKIASQNNLKEPILVPNGEEEKFLYPKSVLLLPVVHDFLLKSQGLKESPLEDLNIKHIGHLLNLSLIDLKVIFNELGEKVYSSARGIDYEPVRKNDQSNLIVKEKYLSTPTNSNSKLLIELQVMLDDACLDLRRLKKEVKGVEIFFRYEDFKAVSKKINLKNNLLLAQDLWKICENYFLILLERRTSIIYLKISLDLCSTEFSQLSFMGLLEESATSNENKLHSLMDQINIKTGKEAISFGRKILVS